MKWNFILEKFCDLMIGAENLSGKLVYADKLFAKKPQTLGEGLARIKAKFGVVASTESATPNVRRYVAKDGSEVVMFNHPQSLAITKEVQPVSVDEFNKVFSNELAKVEKDYSNLKLGDEVYIDRSIDLSYFKPAKHEKGYNKIATLNAVTPERQGIKYADFNLNREYYHNTRNIPYAKASAMGLKV